MTQEEMAKRIAELEAKLAASADENRVEEGMFQGNRTLTFYAKGKRPFTLGEGKCKTVYDPDLMAKAKALLAKPKPFDSKS